MKIIFTIFYLSLTLGLYSQSRQSVTVYFDFDQYSLTAEARKTLDSVWQNIKTYDNKEIELRGHCDNRGSNEYNDRLSEKRVGSVKEYLVNLGAKDEDFKSVGFAGEKEPLNTNSDEREMKLNRRVDIKYSIGSQEEKPLTLKEKIADSTLKEGTNIVLRNINFVGGSHRILEESETALRELLDAMTSYPGLEIRVEGHICCEPGPGDGLDFDTNIRNLSEARARAVRDYLMANGVSASRISFKGFGHSMPVFPYPEQTEEERITNRRVEIKILKK